MSVEEIRKRDRLLLVNCFNCIRATKAENVKPRKAENVRFPRVQNCIKNKFKLFAKITPF